MFAARTPERGGAVHRVDLGGYDELLGLDFSAGPLPGEPVEQPLLLVCTHGKHDPCCARRGRPLYDALREQAEPAWVWQTSHVGGDRFAGNLVCLREGLYFGRVEPADVFGVLDDYLAGRIHLPRYRGRSCYPFAVQAAERALREREGLAGLDELSLVRAVRAGGGWQVAFRLSDGSERELAVREVDGPLAPLTCSAEGLRRPRGYLVADG